LHLANALRSSYRDCERITASLVVSPSLAYICIRVLGLAPSSLFFISPTRSGALYRPIENFMSLQFCRYYSGRLTFTARSRNLTIYSKVVVLCSVGRLTLACRSRNRIIYSKKLLRCSVG
ncbi:MAG: hypothetical protein RR416_01705, partial [Clostridia bacterium]